MVYEVECLDKIRIFTIMHESKNVICVYARVYVYARVLCGVGLTRAVCGFPHLPGGH